MLPPTGTITFLFTDIDDSIRLWERDEEAMRLALARHASLLRDAIDSRGGYVVKSTGDGILAAFPTASQAMDAVLAAQRSLIAEPWDEAVPIRARMALHTGTAEARDGDYYGPALNRGARLLAAGHGGQVLISTTTYELVRDQMPRDSDLKDLGPHLLKDLDRPEQVYQLTHPDLPGAFPPLRARNSIPNNLPHQLTSFVGREKEMFDIVSLLDRTRLLTLTGAGGCGKTRLCLQVATDLRDAYPDGLWLIELAPLADPALVPHTVASVLDIREQAGQSLIQTVIASLRSRRLLLILDNCEHLLTDCAQFAAAVLRSCPNVRVLATSREPLGIGGEQIYRVPSLSLPDLKRSSDATAQSLKPYEAVRLFVERALLVKPDFAVTNGNAPALAQVCYRLDGLPLAIELAAARARSLSVEDIHDRLDSRFRLLTGGDRTTPPRQQTLRDLVDWSYDLLTESEKTLFARLSVFSGGWSLPAAEIVCGFAPLSDWEVLDLLTGLVNKSLVLAEEAEGTTRYRLLETLRQYAAEKRNECGETAQLRGRHRDWLLALAEEAEPRLQGPDQAEWFTRLEMEHDNLRAALSWCAVEDGAEESESGLRLSGALSWFWLVRGYLAEGREHLTRMLAAATSPGAMRSSARAKALHGSMTLAKYQGDFETAWTLGEESLVLRREMGDRRGIAASLNSLGSLASGLGDYPGAQSLYEESLAIVRELDDKRGVAAVLINLGNVAMDQGDYRTAQVFYAESLTINRERGDRRGIANSLINLGNVANAQGDDEAARAHYEESLHINREIGNKNGIVMALSNLGNIATGSGDYPTAWALHEESLAINREMGDKRNMEISLSNMGVLAKTQGDYATAQSLQRDCLVLSREQGDRRAMAQAIGYLAELAFLTERIREAVVLWGAASALRESIGFRLLPGQQAMEDEEMAQARSLLSSLSADAFTIAWNEGRSLPWEQAAALALGEGS